MRIQLSDNEILIGFVASCIQDVADKLGLDYVEVYRRMESVGMIDTLKRWEAKK